MEGPKAPRDPEKMRPYFYILKDKEIFGSKQEDGTGIQFVYESDGRLINSAQIAGNITDQEELALLENVEGFRKLVHSIGISVELVIPESLLNLCFRCMEKRISMEGNESENQTARRWNGEKNRSVRLYMDRR